MAQPHVKGRGRLFLARQIVRAEAAGHVISVRAVSESGDPDPRFRLTRAQTVCSCGWSSNPLKRREGALSAAMLHVGEVCGGRGKIDDPVDEEALGVSLRRLGASGL
jgi:hypothetical protein